MVDMEKQESGTPPRMSRLARIQFAQDFFRFAYRIGTPISYGINLCSQGNPALVVFGEHHLAYEDLNLDQDTFSICGTLLERLAYRVLAMELNVALEEKFGNWKIRSEHPDDLIRNASIVIWIIRNAVAHDVIEPVWKIADPRWQNKEFRIDDVLVFKTVDEDGISINGRPLRRSQFGGPVALFRLSEKILPLIE